MALFRDDRKLNVSPRDKARSYLALSRLIPLLRPGRRTSDAIDERYYSLSPGQNPLEIRLASSLFHLTWTLLLCGAISHLGAIPALFWPLILAGCICATPLLIVAIIGITEPLVRRFSRAFPQVPPSLVHSFFQQGILLIAAVEAALDSHWVRWVGIVWIVLLSLELFARLIEAAIDQKERESSEN